MTQDRLESLHSGVPVDASTLLTPLPHHLWARLHHQVIIVTPVIREAILFLESLAKLTNCAVSKIAVLPSYLKGNILLRRSLGGSQGGKLFVDVVDLEVQITEQLADVQLGFRILCGFRGLPR